MPLGLNAPSVFGMSFAVIGPAFLATHDAMLAWEIGMAVTVLGRSALVPGMREIGVNEGFSQLPAVDLLLLLAVPTSRRRPSLRRLF